MRLSKLALAATLIFGVSGVAFAQDHDRGQDNNREERSEAYQDGLRDGQRDRTPHHPYRIPTGGRWEDRPYRETYEHGYRAGYGDTHDRDHDRADAYRHEPDAAPGPGRPAPGPMGNQPYKIGYNDGYSQGLGDKNNGHSFRPPQHGYYSYGDHGYSSVWGDKNQYKAQYRQGYMAGYQRGYSGR